MLILEWLNIAMVVYYNFLICLYSNSSIFDSANIGGATYYPPLGSLGWFELECPLITYKENLPFGEK